MLFGTLGASLLGNMLAGKGIVRAGYESKKGKGIVRVGYGNKQGKGILRAAYVIKKVRNETRFNGVYSRDNFPKKLKDGTFVINLDEYADVGTYCIALYLKNNEIIYFDSFGVEHVPKEIKKYIGQKNIKNKHI